MYRLRIGTAAAIIREMNRDETLSICVYCSSSDAVGETYARAAEELGAEIGRRGDTLIYGGGRLGLMGRLARAVHSHGGRVIGVIPERLVEKKLAYHEADELIVTDGMHDRKAIMEERADGFIALPGGFGTLEEIVEVLTLKQLRFHSKPIVFLNTCNYYDPLLDFFEAFYRKKFAEARNRDLYYVASESKDALSHVDDILS